MLITPVQFVIANDAQHRVNASVSVCALNCVLVGGLADKCYEFTAAHLAMHPSLRAILHVNRTVGDSCSFDVTLRCHLALRKFAVC